MEKNDCTIKHVEILSVGEWNGNKVTQKDLQSLVDTFEATYSTFKPPLKLGHDDEQKLLQEDGQPAAGWISALKIKGEKLVADFVDVPKKIFELIEKGAYKKVSSEIFSNIKIGKEQYRKMLGAVAILGADTPAVMNLNDILANYYKSGFENEERSVIIYTHDMEGNEDMEKNQELEQSQQKELELLKKEKTELNEQVEELTKFKAEAQEQMIKIELQKKQAEIEKFIAEMEKENLVTPAMKPYMIQLLDDKENYSIGDKELSKNDLVKEMLRLHKEGSKVNFSDKSVDQKSDDKDNSIAKVSAYAKENKCDFTTAYKHFDRKDK